MEDTGPRRSLRGNTQSGKSDVLFELLLLGADGSGKSTFIRQMQLIHGQGFNDDERADLIPFVHKNIFDAMDTFISQMSSLDVSFSDPLREDDVSLIQTEGEELEKRLSAAQRLWADPAIQTIYKRRSEYSTHHPINVSTRYFLDALERINVDGYLPTTDDVIRVRKSTVGVIQYEFIVSGCNFKITDVGGERAERENWIDFLAQRVTCVIFLAAIDEYDTYLVTENGQTVNRLSESIDLFRQIQLQNYLKHTTFILFLNKKDIFEEKIKTSHIVDHFEDFHGFKGEAVAAYEFIRTKFHETQPKNRPRSRTRMIYTHHTTATGINPMIDKKGKLIFLRRNGKYEVCDPGGQRHNFRIYN